MNHVDNAAKANNMATAAFLFALIAAAFSALTFFMLPGLVQKGMENVEAMKVGGPEKYEQLKKIYQENAAVFGEQVDQIQAQIDMYKQMQIQADGSEMLPTETSGDGTSEGTLPSESMMLTGDEAMSQ